MYFPDGYQYIKPSLKDLQLQLFGIAYPVFALGLLVLSIMSVIYSYLIWYSIVFGIVDDVVQIIIKVPFVEIV